MKILVTHSSNFDFKKELYLPLRNSELNNKHSFILPHELDTIPFTRTLMENKDVDLQIAEVSYPSTGQGIEMGWANAFNINLICIYKKGTTYSGSIKLICNTFFEYNSSEEMIIMLTPFLEKYEKT
jgi:hypothetical protein